VYVRVDAQVQRPGGFPDGAADNRFLLCAHDRSPDMSYGAPPVGTSAGRSAPDGNDAVAPV
jgi:hypothetical protein